MFVHTSDLCACVHMCAFACIQIAPFTTANIDTSNDVDGEAPVGCRTEQGNESDHPINPDKFRSSVSRRSKIRTADSEGGKEIEEEKREQAELRDVVDRKSVHLNAVRLKYDQVRLPFFIPYLIPSYFIPSHFILNLFHSAPSTARAMHLPACLLSFSF